MKASVERLRWVLAGSAVLLLVVLVGFLGYGRYRAGKIWQGIVKRSGVHITHETDGFTYSQTLKGRTVFTLHAAKAIQHGDGKWTLHDVVVTLYGKNTTDVDHIYCSDVEYDENTGVATALGEVHMDLHAPGALAGNGMHTDDEPEGEHVIHVRTSGLVFVKKLGVAATPEPVEFRYAGMQCTAKGAEFDSGESGLHLLADVVLTGSVRGAPLTVHAVRADLNRQSNTIALVQAVGQSQGKAAAAANAVLHLRNDGSLEQAEGSGGVTLDNGTRHITAANFAGSFGATSLPVATKLTGSVVMTDSSAKRPLHAQAGEVDTNFNPLGEPLSVMAVGGAQVAFNERRDGRPDLPREMRGDRISGTFQPVVIADSRVRGGHKTVSRLSEIHATGSAMAQGDSLTASAGKAPGERKSTRVDANDLRALFDPGEAEGSLRQLFGTGATRLQQNGALGAQESSSADSLEVHFAKPVEGTALQILSATQVGHVVIHSVPAAKAGVAQLPSDAGGARAVYDGATEKLTVSGEAHFMQGDTALTAATIMVDQRTGDASAEGAVMASLASAKAAGGAPVDMTHLSAERARFARALQLDEFTGTDAKPARLWQGASQVQAASLLFDQKRRSLAARPAAAGGLVHAVFADASKGKGTHGGDVVRVASAAMDYDDVNREATFMGGVHVDGETGQARAQRGVVLLNAADAKTTAEGSAARPNPFGGANGSVRRIVLNGEVKIDQPGRIGTGEQMVYTAADSSFILTGTAAKPPHVVDATQGSITGATLLFHSGDKTVVAAGAPVGEKQAKPGRVRSEIEVKQGTGTEQR